MAQLASTWKEVSIASALVELKVPKLIPVDGSGVHVAKLAKQAKVDTDLLYRYMRFLSALGVFKELPDKQFAHTESSKLLLPGNLTFYMLLFFESARSGKLVAAAEFATRLEDPSNSAVEHVLNLPFWQRIAKFPELEKHFADYMTFVSNRTMPELLQNIKLPKPGLLQTSAVHRVMSCSNFFRRTPS